MDLGSFVEIVLGGSVSRMFHGGPNGKEYLSGNWDRL